MDNNPIEYSSSTNFALTVLVLKRLSVVRIFFKMECLVKWSKRSQFLELNSTILHYFTVIQGTLFDLAVYLLMSYLLRTIRECSYYRMFPRKLDSPHKRQWHNVRIKQSTPNLKSITKCYRTGSSVPLVRWVTLSLIDAGII